MMQFYTENYEEKKMTFFDELFMMKSAEVFILALLAIVFLQSGIDKITDWAGNLGWLNGHFSETMFKSVVSPMLATILVLEVLTGLLAIAGIVTLVMSGSTLLGLYACQLAAVTFLMLFFGQRIAKDYPGAETIVNYFVIAIIGMYLLK